MQSDIDLLELGIDVDYFVREVMLKEVDILQFLYYAAAKSFDAITCAV